MELVAARITEEQETVHKFAELIYISYGCNSILKERVEILADKISDYVPEDKKEFVESEKYKTYRFWIRTHFIKCHANEHEKAVLQLADPPLIKALSEEDKEIRRKYSNRVSDALRKMKNHLYPHVKRLHLCIICELEITRLDLRCLECNKHYHLRCLQNEQLICLFCHLNFNENALIVLPPPL
jgi:hypothetical protein